MTAEEPHGLSDAGPVLSFFRSKLLVGLTRKADWRRCHLNRVLEGLQQPYTRNARSKPMVVAGSVSSESEHSRLAGLGGVSNQINK